MRDIIVATLNEGKLNDFKFILRDYNVIGMKEAGIDVDIEETGLSFMNNALLKAHFVNDYILNRDKKYFDGVILSDDSGLLVDALNGFPGIVTKRFLGVNVSDKDRNSFIINELNKIPNCDRRAEVCTTVVAIKDGDNIYQSTGEIEGVITLEERGKNGFGFDSIFQVTYDKGNANYTGRYDGLTLAELPTREKNRISSRRRALNKFIKAGVFNN